jgi:ribonuclease HI
MQPSDSKSAVQAIGNLQSPKTTEVQKCQKLAQILMTKNKVTVLQWIPGHCEIAQSKTADALADKATLITPHCRNHTPKDYDDDESPETCNMMI